MISSLDPQGARKDTSWGFHKVFATASWGKRISLAVNIRSDSMNFRS
jgi:hypothetical protein